MNKSLSNRKILIVRNAFEYDFGGGERFPVELADQLNELGYESLLVSRSPKLIEFASSRDLVTLRGWWWSRQDWGGWRATLVPFYLLWQIALALWYVLMILKVDLDILHLQSKDDFVSGTIAAHLLRKRVIWTDHADLKYIYGNHQTWYKNPVGKLVYAFSKTAHAVTLVSQSEKKLIEEKLGHATPPNYVVVHNGIPSTAIKKVARKKLDEDFVIFAATSRLVSTKGIGELIEAFKELDDNGSGARLWLFGEGPEREYFQKMATGNQNIVFFGYPTDTLGRIAECDVFVHPSYHEGFSLSIIEAAKLGLPIIACGVGGNPEIIENGKNGVLVPPCNVEALGAAMKKLLSDKDLRRDMGAAAKKTYLDRFVLEKIVKEKFIPLYED